MKKIVFLIVLFLPICQSLCAQDLDSVEVILAGPASVRSGPGVLNDIITRLRAGDAVTVLDVAEGDYLEISFPPDGSISKGFIHGMHLPENDEIDEMIDRAAAIKDEKTRLLREADENFRSNPIYVSVLTANFRQDGSSDSDIITRLDQGHRIFVQEKIGGWYRGAISNSRFRGNKLESEETLRDSYLHGWIHESVISEDRVRKLTPSQFRKRKFISDNPNISEQHKEDILEGTIRIGMTSEMVEAARGKPSDINRTVNQFGINEQWIYGSVSNRLYIYIDDGIMTSFQD